MKRIRKTHRKALLRIGIPCMLLLVVCRNEVHASNPGKDTLGYLGVDSSTRFHVGYFVEDDELEFECQLEKGKESEIMEWEWIIYNRWGNEVSHTFNEKYIRFNRTLEQSYYWKLIYRNKNTEEKTLTGKLDKPGGWD